MAGPRGVARKPRPGRLGLGSFPADPDIRVAKAQNVSSHSFPL